MIGKRDQVGVAGEVALAHVGERPDDDVPAVVGHELGRHRLQLAAEEQVEEERRQDVVAVVPERDLGRAELARHPVEHAAAQARAQRAHRPALGDHPLDHAVRVLLDDPVTGCRARRGSAAARRPGSPGCFWSRLTAMTSKSNGRAILEREQDVEQAVAVLAARHADHHPVARRDQAVVADRLADLAAQPLPELVGLELGLARVAPRGGRRGRRRRNRIEDGRGGHRQGGRKGVASCARRGSGRAPMLACAPRAHPVRRLPAPRADPASRRLPFPIPHAAMPITVSDRFDSGAIEFLSASPDGRVELALRADSHADFRQWFHFRLQGARGLPLRIQLRQRRRVHLRRGLARLPRRRLVRPPALVPHRHHVRRPADGRRARAGARQRLLRVLRALLVRSATSNCSGASTRSPRARVSRLGGSVEGRDVDLVTVGDAGDRTQSGLGDRAPAPRARRWPSGSSRGCSTGCSIATTRSRVRCSSARCSTSCRT